MNEADTCRKFVVPKLQAAGWDNERHSELDGYGHPTPDEKYGTKDFERTVALRARTEATALHEKPIPYRTPPHDKSR